MDMYKHTKGDWEFSDMSGVTIYDVPYASAHIGANEELIAMLGDNYENHETVIANARLMAAAPEMLKALVLCCNAFENLHMLFGHLGDDVDEAIEAHTTALESIYKATNSKYETNS
jgi:hypothetical protein